MTVQLLAQTILPRVAEQWRARADAHFIDRVWKPQVPREGGLSPSPQELFIASSDIDDMFCGSGRGGGKSDVLLGDWLHHQARWGSAAQGIFLRRTYKELEEIEVRCHELFPRLGALHRAVAATWRFPNGANLKLRYLQRDEDAEAYYGHQYTWVGVDEMQNFPRPQPIDLMRATMRSARGVKCVMRCAGTSGGRGHNWIKARYVDAAPARAPFTVTTPGGGVMSRMFVPMILDDNVILHTKDPTYWSRIEAAAGGREWLLKAWRLGIWDITAGGMFDDIWDRTKHVLEPFALSQRWRLDRSFDWGSTKPFSVGWWAESDGLPFGERVFPRGTLIRVQEWYGWTGEPDHGVRMPALDVGRQIVAKEKAWREQYGWVVRPGPADPSIYTRAPEKSVADELAMGGAGFVPANMRPAATEKKGARQAGWERMRRMLLAAREGRKDEPGLYVFAWCTQFIRSVPALARDDRDQDDVDTNQEDHVADETRYRIMGARQEFIQREVRL